MSDKKSPHRFKVGDRVIYHVASGVGYDVLDGCVGTVIGVDSSNLPYTVEFDDEFPDAMEDMFFGGEKGHCWCCSSERLTPAGTKRKRKKGNPGYAGVNCGMTDVEVNKVREMIEAGEPLVNIADVLGVTLTTLKNKLHVLRQRDPSFPRAHRGGKRETCENGENAGGEDAPGDGEGLEDGVGEGLAPPAKLNDLEAVLAERVRELTEECERMKVYTEDLEADVDKLTLQKKELLENNAKLKETNIELTEENKYLSDHRFDLEEEVSNLTDEKEEQRLVIESLSHRLLDTDKLDEALCQARLTIAEREAEISAQFSRIAELTGEVKRLTDMCMKLTERFVLGEGRL